MNTIHFSYNGKTIASDIKYSSNKESKYFWCYLNDPDLIDRLGKNCILFINHNGKLKTPHYYPTEYQALIYNLENSIKQHIGINQSS